MLFYKQLSQFVKGRYDLVTWLCEETDKVMIDEKRDGQISLSRRKRRYSLVLLQKAKLICRAGRRMGKND